MDQSQVNGHASLLNEIDEEFEFMGDIPREDSVIVEVKWEMASFNKWNLVSISATSSPK